MNKRILERQGLVVWTVLAVTFGMWLKGAYNTYRDIRDAKDDPEDQE